MGGVPSVVTKVWIAVLFHLLPVSLAYHLYRTVAPIFVVKVFITEIVCGLLVNAVAVLLVKEPTPLSKLKIYLLSATLSCQVMSKVHGKLA